MSDKEQLMEAVRLLREAMGKTQQEFAPIIHRSYPMVQRYERQKPPVGPLLLQLAQIARENLRPDLAELFQKEYEREIGFPSKEAATGKNASPPKEEGMITRKADSEWHKMLQFIFDNGNPQRTEWLKGNIQSFYDLAVSESGRSGSAARRKTGS